ncbi:hypothetical protein [Pseudomonas alvandae]|uniref:Uncharacterized protein n=1 Tax=Pseudomonas canavaninivorans TaxID=2842348 RepID=A0ABX8Q7V9_PSECO|nr:hypothetical protein [Pseudomonas alvandae]QXI51361.1 hypothetical protein KSS97_17630 [Pseudomonas alvandae]
MSAVLGSAGAAGDQSRAAGSLHVIQIHGNAVDGMGAAAFGNWEVALAIRGISPSSRYQLFLNILIFCAISDGPKYTNPRSASSNSPIGFNTKPFEWLMLQIKFISSVILPAHPGFKKVEISQFLGRPTIYEARSLNMADSVDVREDIGQMYRPKKLNTFPSFNKVILMILAMKNLDPSCF